MYEQQNYFVSDGHKDYGFVTLEERDAFISGYEEERWWAIRYPEPKE